MTTVARRGCCGDPPGDDGDSMVLTLRMGAVMIMAVVRVGVIIVGPTDILGHITCQTLFPKHLPRINSLESPFRLVKQVLVSLPASQVRNLRG